MHATPELVSLIQRERERDIDRDHVARIAACARACRSASVSLATRIARAVRVSPASRLEHRDDD